MSASQLFHARPRWSDPNRRDVRIAQLGHVPRQNLILAALPDKEYARLLPHLEAAPLPAGSILHAAGVRQHEVHFITAGIIARVCATEDGTPREIAVVGNEGVVGVSTFMGGETTTSHAVVLSPGHAYKLPEEALKREFEQDGPLPRLLLRYMQALITQIGQNAACNRHHALEQRLCRWILSCLDRLSGSDLAMTQEAIAAILGVRRSGVTEAAGNLQDAGLIRCHRGHITVLDRAGLEQWSCECYGVVKHEYERLLPPPAPRCGEGRPATVTRIRAFAPA